jgi:hypothetical protein
MRTFCLAVLLIAANVGAAPAPESSMGARQKLEVLRKRLPSVVEKWLKDELSLYWLPKTWTCKPEVRLVRRVGPERAKVVICFKTFDEKGARQTNGNLLLNVFLNFHDGCWTTESFESFGYNNVAYMRTTFAFLALAIDEIAEQPEPVP